jgi:hypothetical protein
MSFNRIRWNGVGLTRRRRAPSNAPGAKPAGALPPGLGARTQNSRVVCRRIVPARSETTES